MALLVDQSKLILRVGVPWIGRGDIQLLPQMLARAQTLAQRAKIGAQAEYTRKYSTNGEAK